MAKDERQPRELSREGFFAFEDLDVYHLSVRVVGDIYRLSQQLPSEERFGLTNQLRRAAVSITLNIAEGRGRSSDKDFARFLIQARGSAYEVVAGLHLCVELGYMNKTATMDVSEQLRILCAMLSSLARKLGAQ